MTNKKIDISIIIINFNTAYLTINAIRSCYRFIKKYTLQIIVVDNSSSDVEDLEKELHLFPDVILIKSTENIGFGRANNLGYRFAEGEFIFLMNSDSYLVNSSAINLMIKPLRKSFNIAITGPSFLKKDGSKNYSYGNYLKFKKILHDLNLFSIPKSQFHKYKTYSVCDFKKNTKVNYLSGAGIMIKSSVIKKIGLFDPQFFLYFEDMELGWRYNKKGYESVIVPAATMVHLGGSSSSPSNTYILSKIRKSKDYYIKKTIGVHAVFIVYFFNTLKKLKKII